MTLAAQVPQMRARRRRGQVAWIVAVTVAVLAGAALLSWTRTPVYRATADVLVESQTPTVLPPDMGTERTVASSAAVLDGAARALGLNPQAMLGGLSVTVPVDTHVLRIADDQRDPAEARRRAQGVAEAYVAYRSAPTAGTATAWLITPARTPLTPVAPNHLVDLGVALLVGLSLAVGTALLRERRDDRLRDPDDLTARVGAPLLAVVPAFRGAGRGPGGRLVVARNPHSRPAEAYRDLRSRLERAAPATDTPWGRTVLVTSAAGEDRTTVAANLAAALALAGRQVILVCAELRRPRLHELFAVDNAVGLADVAAGAVDLAAALRPTDVGSLRLLPAGPFDADRDAVPPYGGVPGVLGALRRWADYVVVEAPALGDGAEAEALLDHADLVVFVADARLSRRARIATAVRALEPVRAALVGCVLDNAGRRHWLPREPRWAAPVDAPPPAPDSSRVLRRRASIPERSIR